MMSAISRGSTASSDGCSNLRALSALDRLHCSVVMICAGIEKGVVRIEALWRESALVMIWVKSQYYFNDRPTWTAISDHAIVIHEFDPNVVDSFRQ